MERRQIYLDMALVAATGVLLAAGLLGYLAAALLGGFLVSLAFIHDEL